MNTGAVLIGLAILVIAFPYVVTPLMNERKRQSLPIDSHQAGTAISQKDALVAIRDLDFDFRIGKLTQEDYEAVRAKLIVDAAEYLHSKRQEEKVDAMIHTRLQAVKSVAQCARCGGDIRSKDLFCPTCGVAVKNQVLSNESAPQITCPGCGKSAREEDLYCTRCGTQLDTRSAA